MAHHLSIKQRLISDPCIKRNKICQMKVGQMPKWPLPNGKACGPVTGVALPKGRRREGEEEGRGEREGGGNDAQDVRAPSV